MSAASDHRSGAGSEHGGVGDVGQGDQPVARHRASRKKPAGTIVRLSSRRRRRVLAAASRMIRQDVGA